VLGDQQVAGGRHGDVADLADLEARVVDGFDDAQFVVLYPRDNEACRKAVSLYRAALDDASSFDTWLLEDVLAYLSSNAAADWPSMVFSRYCDFSRLEKALGNGTSGRGYER
jgi:hypothetical protein